MWRRNRLRVRECLSYLYFPFTSFLFLFSINKILTSFFCGNFRPLKFPSFTTVWATPSGVLTPYTPWGPSVLSTHSLQLLRCIRCFTSIRRYLRHFDLVAEPRLPRLGRAQYLTVLYSAPRLRSRRDGGRDVWTLSAKQGLYNKKSTWMDRGRERQVFIPTMEGRLGSMDEYHRVANKQDRHSNCTSTHRQCQSNR